MTPDSKKNNTPEKDTAKTATTPDPKVKASKPTSDESTKSNAVPKDSKKGLKAPKKKQSYKIVGGCVAAALLVACIGFASCNAGGSSKATASATPTASAKAETLYANAKDVTLLDANGKETTDKITVATVKKADATQASLKDWYFNYVVKGGYKYGILKFSDESGKGIYADSTGIYEDELKEDTATKGYTKPADSDLVYTIDTSKKTLTKKASASASAEASASAGADSTSDSGDTVSDNDSASSNTASDSGTGSSNTSGSTASKSASGTSNKSSNSSSSSGNSSSSNSSKTSTQTCRTVHHDAVTTQQWVQDSAAWDETVVDQAAYDEPIYTWMPRFVCKACGYTTDDIQDIGEHCFKEGSTYYNDPYQVQSGTQHHDAVTHVVHHDATGHYETVVTQAAYDETVCG